MKPDQDETQQVAQSTIDSFAGSAAELLKPGIVLDERIRIEELIHSGPMSCVYRATHLSMERSVAVKTLNVNRSSDKDSAERFRREAKVISRLEHPGIVKVYAMGVTAAGMPYFVMDFKTGDTLAAACAKGELATREEFLEVCLQLLDALRYAHSHGVIHRDIKPSNVIIERNNNSLTACLVDFGIARLLDEEQKLTKTGVIIGSPLYMSPEQCMGKEVTPLTDVYAFGCVMYYLIAGVPPFDASDPVDVMRKHCMVDPPDLATRPKRFAVPPDLVRVVNRALKKEPEDRYPDAEAMHKDLLLVKLGLPLPQEGAATRVQVRLPAWAVLFVLGGVLAALTLGLVCTKGVDRSVVDQAQLEQAARLVKGAIHSKRRLRWEECDHMLDQALAIYLKAGYKGDQLADIYHDKGLCNDHLGRFAVAEDCFYKALKYRTGKDEKDMDAVAAIKVDLGYCLAREGKYTAAMPLLKEAVSYFKSLPPTHSDGSLQYIVALQNMAKLQVSAGYLTDAADSYAKLITEQRQYETSPGLIAKSLRQYEQVLRMLKRNEDAAQAAHEAAQLEAKDE